MKRPNNFNTYQMHSMHSFNSGVVVKYLAFVLLAFTGCSTVQYSEPLEGDRARVRFATGSEAITIVREYSDENCSDEKELMRLRDGPLIRSSQKTLGIPLSNFSKNAAKEFYFESGVDHHFMFFGSETIGTTTSSCAVPVEVRFETDKDYELHYTSSMTDCQVRLSQVVETEGQPERDTINIYGNGVSEGCRAAFKKSRWW